MVNLITTSSLLSTVNSQYLKKDIQILQGQFIIKKFGFSEDYIELSISDLNKNLLDINYNYIQQQNSFQPQLIDDNNLYSEIRIEPEKEITSRGLIGEYILEYNFYRKKITNGPSNKLFIKEISPSRKEIRLSTNDIALSDFQVQAQALINEIRNSAYKKEYLLNFGNNKNQLITNIAFENNTILFKLYEPLKAEFQLNDQLWVVEKIAESIQYNVSTTLINLEDESPKLRAPNFDININENINIPSNYETISSLLTSNNTNFYQELLSLIEDKSLNININYNFYENFIHFSSASERLKNFTYKISLIEKYKNEISNLNNIPNGTLVPSISGNIVNIQNQIDNIIKKFDGYEKFLYFTSGSSPSGSNSYPWPKQNSTSPYTLYSITSSQVLSYLGNDNSNSIYYGGQLLSASLYDKNNKDNFTYTIPEYIKENPDNKNYEIFLAMIGQHFDNVWTYSNAITDLYKAQNKLTEGISKDLVAYALKSLGANLYTTAESSNNMFTYLLGFNPSNNIPNPLTTYYSVPSNQSITLSNLTINSNGTLFIPTSSNLIVTNTLTNNGVIINSGSIGATISTGTGTVSPNSITVTPYYNTNVISINPTSGEDYQKEIYKRIYHNLPLLYKAKGTERGLRALISCYGIPDTILRISEFGGADKSKSSIEYDHNRFTYGFKPARLVNGINVGTGNVHTHWAPLNKTFVSSSQVPQSIELRFKPDKLQNLTLSYTQPIIETGKTLGNFLEQRISTILWSIELTKDPSVHTSLKEDYGYLRFKISNGITIISSSNIELPFFNGSTYNLLLTQTPSASGIYPQTGSANAVDVYYNLFAKANTGTYINPQEGDYIGIQGSASLFIPSASSSHYEAYNYITTPTTNNGILVVGGNGLPAITNSTGRLFSGIIQELRFWGEPLSESIFNYHVLNPESYEGNTSSSAYSKLALRLPLGNDLNINYSGGSYITSSHPSSSPNNQYVNSFAFPQFSASYVSGNISRSFQSFTEQYYYNSPNSGLLETITSKIRIISSSLPDNVLYPTNKIETWDDNLTKDSHLLEIAFSPSNEINQDITNQLGFFNIDEYIGDPQEETSGSYFNLNKLKDYYFTKYNNQYNVFDYIRLINFFDNSLFKMIKDYVPARTNPLTGIVIKPHILERNKQPRLPLEFIPLVYSGSYFVEEFSGDSGGCFESTNITNNQYSGQIMGNLGPINFTSGTNNVEYYTGEFEGSIISSYNGPYNPFTQPKYI